MLSAANILPLIVAKISGTPKVIFHSHNGNTVGLHRHILHFIGKFFVCLLSDFKFACSNAAAKFMFSNNKNVKIIRNAIDVSKFRFNEDFRQKIRTEINVTPNDFLIGHIGRFETQKNHRFLIKIFKEVADKLPNARLLLVGTGYAEEETEKLGENLNISDKIIFYGKSDKTHEIYSAFDLFLFPSLFEGLPLVGIEAQCNGLPILASTGISREMQITDLVSWLSLTENEKIWAERIIELSKSSTRKNYSAQIEDAGYSIEKEAPELEKTYLEIAERK
jgi:glycosyltransferase involved in cell wall biosynthesis